MILFLILCDQYFKYLAVHRQLSYDLWILKTTLVKNTGISLGFLGSFSPFFIALLQVVAIVWIYRLKLPRRITILCLAGGLSNLIDRLYYGYVIDYIHFHLFGYPWPTVVNLGDLYLSAAFLLWIKQTLVGRYR